jgi:hypothetical protein
LTEDSRPAAGCPAPTPIRFLSTWLITPGLNNLVWRPFGSERGPRGCPASGRADAAPACWTS